MEQQKKNISLPDNAYRELKAGEEYKPLMPADTTPAEVTPYSVGMGVLMAIIFSAAAALTGSDSTPRTSLAKPFLLRSMAIDPPINPNPIIPTLIISS